VLNAHECCDDCISEALRSLQEIRALLVDKQVALMDHPDSVLFLLVEMMLVALNQFLTFTQRIGVQDRRNQEAYFAALEVLRAHLYRCLSQIARIADYPMTVEDALMRYDDTWQLDAYEPPKLAVENHLPLASRAPRQHGAAEPGADDGALGRAGQ
jgi:hypothetical protein